MGSLDVDGTFTPPSVMLNNIKCGDSYTYFSDVPVSLRQNIGTECVLGIDEAGRGPVLGSMVYALFYLPLQYHNSLLDETHHFDDSKVLSSKFRASLMQQLCTPGNDLYQHCGWATRVISARDISAGMLRRTAVYNLNAQAMDATIDLIRSVLTQGINVAHIFVDTVGKPDAYQRKLEKIFPTKKITVAKKADSIFPCVSAASVCAKVTRDLALDASYKMTCATISISGGWGSGYPSDARCLTWMKSNMHPIFGWGPECRFSWGTAKDLLENRCKNLIVQWPEEEDHVDGIKMSDFLPDSSACDSSDNLKRWYGQKSAQNMF
ncbi:ribonuclease HII [Verruconis gallopava]|uniref:Ribonuclease n=1 Tax=Verruconis gallopava TaxID=253628 RepID=A0A0D2AIA9_9PEZI|nr:ribonuclease HII [Verruconis gallopava]KIV98653.1 ribonuclease HII [Verruconis gallopava]